MPASPESLSSNYIFCKWEAASILDEKASSPSCMLETPHLREAVLDRGESWRRLSWVGPHEWDPCLDHRLTTLPGSWPRTSQLQEEKSKRLFLRPHSLLDSLHSNYGKHFSQKPRIALALSWGFPKNEWPFPLRINAWLFKSTIFPWGANRETTPEQRSFFSEMLCEPANLENFSRGQARPQTSLRGWNTKGLQW